MYRLLTSLSVLATVSLISLVRAQAPETISVQGYLTNPSGTPINGPHDLTFSLFDAPSGGAQVWTQEIEGVTITEGIYNVFLGPEGTPALHRVPFIDPLWLVVEVDGETLVPPIALASAPYALGLRGLQVIPHPEYFEGLAPPSLIGGYKANRIHNNAMGATISGGGDGENLNRVGGDFGTVGGGLENQAGYIHDWSSLGFNPYATVAGGTHNTAVGYGGTVAGGGYNEVVGRYGTIGGGHVNVIGARDDGTEVDAYGVIGGGERNGILSSFGVIGGGGRFNQTRAFGNVIYDPYGVIGGGADNTVGIDNTIASDGQYSTVGGGFTNLAEGPYATVGGGRSNHVHGAHATISGGQTNEALWLDATVGGGYSNLADATASTVGGGSENRSLDDYSTIAGGQSNIAGTDNSNKTDANYASVGGGYGNHALHLYARVGGGSNNEATGQQSTVAGGDENYATGRRSTVGGGSNNFARGENATVAGGAGNEADGHLSMIPGGLENQATGSFSFAAGRQAEALHNGTFVWADSGTTAMTSTGDNQFLIRATGGVGIGAVTPIAQLHVSETATRSTMYVKGNYGGGIPGATMRVYNTSAGSGVAGYFESAGSDATFIVKGTGSGTLLKAYAGSDLRFQVTNAGEVYADGTFHPSGADLAESFRVAGSASSLGPGDVLQVSDDRDYAVELVAEPYSTRVAGVYATRPGVLLADQSVAGSSEHQVPLGVVGVIPTKVCDEGGPIARGDLLVSSSTPGHAMKADPSRLGFGMIIGKALETFSEPGSGVIRVLVTQR